MAYNPLNPNGQATMANSQPVVIASNQTPVSVSGTVSTTQSGTVRSSISGTVFVDVISSTLSIQGTTPWIITGSVQASLTPAANQSVSGTVGASIIGVVPTTQSGTLITSIVSINPSSVQVQVVGDSNNGSADVSNRPVGVGGRYLAAPGSYADGNRATMLMDVNGRQVVTLGGTSAIGVIQSSVAVAIISGSIAATFTPPANQSVSGTVQTDVRSSVAVVIIGGSIAASFTPPANQSVSGTVNIGTGGPVSVLGTMSVLGTVPVTQVTTPWIITGSVQGSFSPSGNQSVSGTVGASIIGTIPVVQSGINISSISGGSLNVASLISIPAIISTANSSTSPVTSTLAFTGTGEEWKDFGSITLNVFTDAASATDGLSIQQSSDNVNWDIRDTYTIPSMASGGGKTFQVQPAARFGRVVYTQGPVNSGAFRLQTIYHPQMVKASSQRASDGYTNETDLDQNQVFNMYLNSAGTWDRMRGNLTNGLLTYGSVQATITGNPSVSGTVGASIIGTVPVVQSGTVVASISGGQSSVFQAGTWSVSVVGAVSSVALIGANTVSVVGAVSQTGTVITSVIGGYASGANVTNTDPGILVVGQRNDTLASVLGGDRTYSPATMGPVGEMIVANAPITKWVQGVASAFTGTIQPIIPAQGTSVFTYITGLQIANASANNSYLTLFGATSSVIGFTVVPANGGSNIYYPNGLKTSANAPFSASLSGVGSVFLTAEGFISKT